MNVKKNCTTYDRFSQEIVKQEMNFHSRLKKGFLFKKYLHNISGHIKSKVWILGRLTHQIDYLFKDVINLFYCAFLRSQNRKIIMRKMFIISAMHIFPYFFIWKTPPREWTSKNRDQQIFISERGKDRVRGFQPISKSSLIISHLEVQNHKI